MINLNRLYNKNSVQEIFAKDFFINKNLEFKVINRGIILPHMFSDKAKYLKWGVGGIVDKEGNYIKSSFTRSYLGTAYTPPPESVQYSSETVIYLGMFHPSWGHVITDNIRRLWLFKSDSFKNHFKDCPLVYIPLGGLSIKHQQNFKRLLEILGVNPEKLQPIYQPIRFENIILFDGSFSGNGFTLEYREMIDHIRSFALKNRMPTSTKKVYYFYGKGQIGEERLAEYFRSKGYEIISPENLTLDEQLNLLINCESFASTLGSCAHNSLFLREGTETILIPRRSGYFTHYQPIIDQVHPLNINYIDSTLSIFAGNVTPLTNCFIISKQLKDFFGDTFTGYSEGDFKIFLHYVKSCMNGGLKVNSDAEPYFGNTLKEFLSVLSQRRDLLTTYGISLN